MSKRTHLEPGEWTIKADAQMPSKFWEALDRLNDEEQWQ